MSGRKVTGLPLPDTPKEAPPELHGLVDAIEDKLGDSKNMEAAQALGCAFDYLTRYFAAVAGAVAGAIGLESATDVAEDFEAAREQLKERLELLGEKSTDPLSKLVRSVFYVGATRKTPTPRRHARLLDLGGIPIRGYLSLGEWIALEPGEKELATDSKANRELLRYLPILKEWVTASAPFFLDATQSQLKAEGDQAVSFDLKIGDVSCNAGPLSLSPALKGLILEHTAASEAPKTEPSPVNQVESDAVASEEATPSELEASDKIQDVGPPEVKAEPISAVSTSQTVVEPPETVVEPPETVVEPPEAPPKSALERPKQPSSAPPEDAEKSPESVSEESASEPPKAVETVPTTATARTEALSPELLSQAVAQAVDDVEAVDPAVVEPEGPEEGEEQPTEVEPLEQVEPPAPVSVPLPEPEPITIEEPTESALTESIPQPPKIPVPQSPPLPNRPNEDELSDPVVAALHVGSKPKQAAPVYQIYPHVTGPPPEFFDEIDVEVDYPEVIRVAITDLNGAIEANDSILICGQMQRCFDILVQFFAGLAGAILAEVSEDGLFGFDVEDARFRELDVKVDLITQALSELEEHWESNDASNLLWSVFYDTLLPATDPNCAYLHTRLLGVEGLVPDPYIEFTELCLRVPGQGKLQTQAQCRLVAHYYLPVLSFWLENAMPLFLECEIDLVEEEDGEAYSWAATVAGATLDGTGPGFWIEVASNRWNLPRPELAPVFVSGDAPDVLLPVFEELNLSLEAGKFSTAGLYTRVALDFLIQYFAGCAASLWRQEGEMTEQALALFYPEASLDERERLLILSLGGVSTESEVGSALSKLFAKGSLQYRALAQRGQPAGMGSVSRWASARDEVSEAQLLTYLPLLRSWIGAANPWFTAGEQLFEEPSSGGILEGVVAFGGEFLEMVDPEYVIQLARESLELVAPFEEEEEEEPSEEVEVAKADTPFTGKLPQLPILVEGPPVLVGHVARLLESADDRRTSNAWLGSSFEYLIQYFAGLCTTILGGGDAPVPNDVKAYFKPSASLRERELLLVACIELLKSSASSSVQESVRDIFLKPDGSYREHAKYLGALGAGSLDENEMLLSYWCRLRHQAGSLTTEDLHFGTRVLNSWLDATKPFFASCEHYAEEPGPEGQEEMVVELADDYLDMVLPDYAIQLPARGYYEVLYSESDREAAQDMEAYFPEDVRPALLGPQEVLLGGVAEEGGEELLGAAADIGVEDLFGGAADASFDADDLFSGSAAATQQLDVDGMFSGAASAPTPVADAPKTATETPEQASASAADAEKKKRKRKKSRKQELGSAVLELYKKERLEKARKRAEARARKEEEEPTRASYSLQYRGLKNSKQLGGRGHFGIIELTNAGGGQLIGTVEPAHPCVRVQPTRFEGNQTRITYQVDPADMPSTGRAGITISTQDERLSLRLDQLVPTSWWRERTSAQALGLLAAPSLVYGVWLLALLGFILGPSVTNDIGFFGRNAELTKMPWMQHLKLWSFAVLAILPGATGVPALIKTLFAKFDYTIQEESRWSLAPLMLLPTVVFLGVMYGTNLYEFDVPAGRLPPLGSRFFLGILLFGMNLLATSLFSLQTTTWWEVRSDSQAAKRTFAGFWSATIILGVVVTFFMW